MDTSKHKVQCIRNGKLKQITTHGTSQRNARAEKIKIPYPQQVEEDVEESQGAQY